MRQAVDRDHQNVMLDALDAPSADEAHHTKAPLRAHLRRRRDNHTVCSRTRARWRPSYVRVFVSIATAIPVGRLPPSRCLPGLPPQRMLQPPPLRPQRRKRTLHVVLRTSTHPATTGEREPVASVETEPERPGGAATRQARLLRRSRSRARAARRRRLRAPRCRRGTADGTAGDARSSRCDRLDPAVGAERAPVLG